jgi:hypothetical protein
MKWLFSKRERQKRARRSRRRAFREAENRIEDVKERIRTMERDSTKEWDKARDALKGGQEAAAQRALKSYRAGQVLMTKLEQKRWVFEQYLTKMEMAQSDHEFAQTLEGVNKVVNIDPERVADVFEASQELLGEQIDADRFWERLYEKEMDGATGSLEDRIPSMEELSEQLRQEAAAEVGGGEATERVSAELDSRIKSGQERVKKLLDDNKQ